MSTTFTNDDGSTTVENDDGSTTTTWPDGRVLNVEPDGTTTLNDADGVALDPLTGAQLGAAPVMERDSPTPEDIEIGVHTLLTVGEAAAIIAHAEGALLFLEPINAVLAPIGLAVAVWHSLEASVRAYGTMGYSYGLAYGALDMGEPGYPKGAFSLDSDETIRDKKASFAAGTGKASEQLGDGYAGVALRNRILLRTAFLGEQPASTLNEIWRAGCENAGDDFYAQHFVLVWPEVGMSEA